LKKMAIPIVIVVILGAIFAGLVYTSNITPIGAITTNPVKYHDTEVTIPGSVSERLAHQNEIVIRVQDDTGAIAVKALGEIPAIGEGR